MPARSASRRRAAASARSCSVDAARVAATVSRIPPAAYGAPAIRAANSSPALAGEDEVRVAVDEARDDAAPARVDALVGVGVPGALDGGDAVAVEHERRVADRADLAGRS